jgi:hypothetical protein
LLHERERRHGIRLPAQASNTRETRMAKKRSGPEPVKPVRRGGIRYEAVPWGKARGLSQNGGYLAAIDDRTGDELWVLKVYDVTYDGDMEADKQDIFVTSLAIEPAGGHLTVENEAGDRFSVDLKSQKVTPA